MDWLAILTVILKVVAYFSRFLGDRQLLERGQANAIAFGLAEILRNVEKANAAAAAVSDPNSNHAKRVRARYERKTPDQ